MDAIIITCMGVMRTPVLIKEDEDVKEVFVFQMQMLLCEQPRLFNESVLTIHDLEKQISLIQEDLKHTCYQVELFKNININNY